MNLHPQNNNLHLWQESTYRGLPVYVKRGPLVTEYLERSLQVINMARQQYGRVFAFRVDLRFPVGQCLSYFDNNQVLERFIASFKAKIRHNRDKAQAINQYAHDTVVRYVWCRELGQHGVPHYHMVILLNNDAFCTLGKFELGRINNFNRLVQAWASALGISAFSACGLIEVPDNHYYLLIESDPEALPDFFYRLSYLCKAQTKYYGDGVHAFGTSRS